MDQLSDKALPVATQHKRQHHSPEFRAKIIALTREPGISVAHIARQYQLNANLIHKWRKLYGSSDATEKQAPAFLPIPVNSLPGQSDKTVRLSLHQLTIDWPLSDIDRAIPWVKALMS